MKVSKQQLETVLPKTALYGPSTEEPAQALGWLLSPAPYPVNTQQARFLEDLGPCLYQFTKTIDLLYKTSLKSPELAWVKTVFQAGKPEQLIKYAEMNRFKHHFPLVIRPDLLVTPDGFRLAEIDAVPGGIGFTGALQQAYQSLGFSLLGEDAGIPRSFLRMLLGLIPQPTEKTPFIAIVVSDEANDYRRELQWLTSQIQAFYPQIELLHPKAIQLQRDRLGFVTEDDQFQSIDIIYRFFELFDLPNIPQMELIQYAVKKGLVQCTPPFKPFLEEKLVLALVHHPALKAFWETHLEATHLEMLNTLIPQSWLLDPVPVPPHARIQPDLQFQKVLLRDFSGLAQLSQKQRELVVKPSGFSPLAWGSRGVKIGHDLPQEAWQQVIEEAFQQFHETPHLLQRFAHSKVEPYEYFNPINGETIQAEGRTRLCPYYFIADHQPTLVGVLATTCPKEKKIIHGMRDGVMRPVSVCADE